MNQILRLGTGAVAALTVATLATPVQALLITQSHKFVTGGGVIGAPIGALGVTVADSTMAGGLLPFDFFDANLGTLNSVKWVLKDASSAFDLDHRAQVTPPPPGPPVYIIVEFSLDAKGDVLGNIGGAALRGTAGQSFNLGAGAVSGCLLVAPPPVPPLPPPGLPGSPGCNQHTGGLNFVALDSLLANPLDFTGVGQFDEEVSSLLKWSTRVDVGMLTLDGAPPLPPILGPGPADVSGKFELAATLELIYDYTPLVDPPGVPLPATPLLLAAGVLALGMSRRKS